MREDAWTLKGIGDFIYLLDRHAPNKNDVLQRRFKKDMDSLTKLFDILSTFDSLGFDGAMRFGQATRRIKSINDKHLILIEIRTDKTLWCVVTYVDNDKKVFVMIDAFKNHGKKAMGKVVEECDDRIRRVSKLVREVE